MTTTDKSIQTVGHTKKAKYCGEGPISFVDEVKTNWYVMTPRMAIVNHLAAFDMDFVLSRAAKTMPIAETAAIAIEIVP